MPYYPSTNRNFGNFPFRDLLANDLIIYLAADVTKPAESPIEYIKYALEQWLIKERADWATARGPQILEGSGLLTAFRKRIS